MTGITAILYYSFKGQCSIGGKCEEWNYGHFILFF